MQQEFKKGLGPPFGVLKQTNLEINESKYLYRSMEIQDNGSNWKVRNTNELFFGKIMDKFF
jgi:hypothetical protein